jgi:hypothetical protein
MMVEEQTILAIERLRDDLAEFRKTLRDTYKNSSNPVRSDGIRSLAAKLAERWLVEIASNDDVSAVIGMAYMADLNVHFQRILTFSERLTKRDRYDHECQRILNNFTNGVIIPLKQRRGRTPATQNPKPVARGAMNSVFIGQSFAVGDASVNKCIAETLEGLGLKVVTGDKPKAASISEKVKGLIDQQAIFVGIFTRRDKLARKQEWTTSNWVIDEKAYALGKQKRLILIKEQGVGSIGGIQGDYEYLEFSREAMGDLVVKLIHLFELSNNGLRG